MKAYINQQLWLNLLISILLLAFFNEAPASRLSSKIIVDVYGSENLSIDDLVKKYHKQFSGIAAVMQSVGGLGSSINRQRYTNSVNEIIAGIQAIKNFNSVRISPVIYPNNSTVYITIDVVEQKDQYHLPNFFAKQNQVISDPDHLIAAWQSYERTGFSFFFQHKKFPAYAICPAYHCLFGFEEPELKKYGSLFSHFVEKDKIQLVDILRHDEDENKRAAAAYLLAHIKSANELVRLLMPSIYDVSEKVRNNTMRVIGMTLLHAPDCRIPIEPIATALNFPSVTDRNKAMFIMAILAKKPDYARWIVLRSGNTLLKILKLQQPNNHDFAYIILKTISGKKYAADDFIAWSAWVRRQQDRRIG